MTLFCLHGFSGRGDAFDRVLACLPPTIEARCPDLLGHGRPPAGAGIRCFDDEVDRLAALVSTDHPPILVGYSLGARLGLSLLARHGQHFRGAVLIGARLPPRDDAARHARIEADNDRAQCLTRDGLEPFVEAWQNLPLFATQARLPAAVRDDHRRRRLSNTAPGLARALEILGLGQMPDDRPRLGALKIPVRLLAGGDDARFCRAADLLSDQLPNARTGVVPGCGHDLLIEAPQAVAAAIQEVLGDV